MRPGESALQSYIEILDAHDRDVADAARRGCGQPLGGPRQDDGEPDGDDGQARRGPTSEKNIPRYVGSPLEHPKHFLKASLGTRLSIPAYVLLK